MDNKVHILVIDDDASTLEILLLILENAGYKVDIARDHNLEMFTTKIYPDLILLDNNLGKINGSDICKKLKAENETRAIPVILISAMDNIRNIAKDARADDFIAKPFSIQKMLEKIESALSAK